MVLALCRLGNLFNIAFPSLAFALDPFEDAGVR